MMKTISINSDKVGTHLGHLEMVLRTESSKFRKKWNRDPSTKEIEKFKEAFLSASLFQANLLFAQTLTIEPLSSTDKSQILLG